MTTKRESDERWTMPPEWRSLGSAPKADDLFKIIFACWASVAEQHGPARVEGIETSGAIRVRKPCPFGSRA